MSIQERLSEYLKNKSLTYKDFEIICGLSNGTAARLRETTRKSTFDRIANNCDLNINWLLTGEGDMLKESATETETEVVETMPVAIDEKDGVPYYDEDFMLGFDELTPHGWEHPEYYIRMPGYEKATMWCNASGNSMEPEISNGDMIAMKKVEDPSFLPFGDIYGIITTNGFRTIKRLGRSNREGYYRLIPTNKECDEQEIPIRMIAVVYRVLGAMKAF